MELCNDPTGWLSADDIINMINGAIIIGIKGGNENDFRRNERKNANTLCRNG